MLVQFPCLCTEQEKSGISRQLREDLFFHVFMASASHTVDILIVLPFKIIMLGKGTGGWRTPLKFINEKVPLLIKTSARQPSIFPEGQGK